MQNVGQRTTNVAVYSRAGWITGTIHIGADQTLLGELNDGGSFFRLTGVQLPMEEGKRDFFAIHAREATIVLPLETSMQYSDREPPNETMRHEVSCLMQEGTILCSIDVLEGCRVSDYLLNHHGFIPIRESHMPVMELPTVVVEPIPIAYLNTSRIIGLAETDSMKADPPPEESKSIFTEV